MTTALQLTVLAAVLHAGWNVLASRIVGGPVVTWAYAAVGAVVLAPWGIPAWLPSVTHDATSVASVASAIAWTFVVVSSVLHVGYFVTLQLAYARGGVSLVYPLARGIGPWIATLLAIAFLGERPGAAALVGTLLVVGSTVVLAWSSWGHGVAASADGNDRPLRWWQGPIGWAIATGAWIGSYTVWDAAAVAHVGVSPLAFAWASELTRALMLTPWAWQRRAHLASILRRHGVSVVAIGVASPVAYLAVLEAFTRAPVSIVAPLREMSILFAVVVGAGWLKEGDAVRRMVAACIMMAGVVTLALAPTG